MSNIKATSAIQTIKLAGNTTQAEKIVIKPGQAIQLMVDGQLYTGQQHINGKAVRLVRKGRTLEIQLDDETMAVVEDYYVNPAEAEHAEAAQLVDLDPLAQALPDTLSAQPLDGNMSAADLQAATTPTPFESTNPWHGTQWAQAASDTKTDAGALDIKATDGASSFPTFATFASLAAVGVVLSSGGGSTIEDEFRKVTGQLMAGPVVAGHGLTVQLYQADGTTALLDAPVVVDGDGIFTATVKNYTGVVIAKVILDADANPDYTDEALGTGKDLNAQLMAAGELTAGSTTLTLNINPLTTVAVVKMSASPAAATVNATNSAVAMAYGLDNLTNTTVIPAVAGSDYDSTDGLTQGELYGAILAAMSGRDVLNDDQTQTTIDQYAAGIDAQALTAAGQLALLQGAIAADATVAGLREALLGTLAPDATADLDPLDISAVDVTTLEPFVVAQLSDDQVASLTDAQLEDLSQYQVAVLSNDQLGGLTDAQVALLALGAISSAQAAAMAAAGNLDNLTAEQVQSLAADAIDSVPTAVLAALSEQDITRLSDAQLAGLTAAQVAALTNTQLAAFSDAQVALLALGSISSAQAAAMATAGNLDSLTAAQVQSLAAEAIDSVPNTVLDSLTAAQVAALSNGQLAGLTAAQVAVLDLSAISSAQAAAMATAGNLSNLTAAQVQSLAADAIDSVPNAVLDSLTAAQVAALSNEQLAGLTAAQVAVLDLSNISSDQAAAMATAGNLSNLTAAQVQSLAADAIDSVPNSVLDSLTAAQVAALSNEQLAGLTAAQVAVLDLSNISSDQAAAMATAGNLSNLTAAQVQSLAADAIDSVPSTVMGAFTAGQVAALSNTQLAGLTDAQVAVLNVSAISSAQAAAMATAGNLDNLTAAQVQSLAADAIDSVPNAVLAGMSGTELAALSVNQTASLTATQINALNTAGLLQDLGHPLTLAQINGSAPAGLALTAISTQAMADLFNEGIQANPYTTDLADLASAVSKIAALADGTDNNAAKPTTDEYTALGVVGMDTPAELGLLGDVLDVKASSAADALSEIQALATAVSTVTAYSGSNTAPSNDQLNALLGTSFVTNDNRDEFLALVATANNDGTPISTLAELMAIRSSFAPEVESFNVTDASSTSPNTVALGKSGEQLSFVVVLSEEVTSTAGLTAVFTVNGVDVTATSAAITTANNVITFTGATVPATGNGTAITLKSLVADSGTIVGSQSGEALVPPTQGAISFTGYTVDNTAPTVSTSTLSVAENATSVGTLAANETVTWSLGTGNDTALFGISGSTLSFLTPKNYEDGVTAYTVNVVATDRVGLQTTRAVTVNLTDVNEAPVVGASAIADVVAVTGTVYTVQDPLFLDGSSELISSYFTDPEGASLTYSLAQGAPAWLSIDASTGKLFGTAPSTGATDLAVTVRATDGTSTVSKSFQIDLVSQPTLKATQHLDNVTNLDVRSELVLDFTETLTLGSGEIRIMDNMGTSGWSFTNQGETRQDTTDNDVIITLTNGVVTHLTVGGVDWGQLGTNGISQQRLEDSVRVDGTKLIIDVGGADATTYGTANTDWTFDWDFGANYHVEFDAGIVTAAGQANVAMTDATRLNFTTVTPVANATGAASQAMASDGTLEASTIWHSAHTSQSSGPAVAYDFGTGNHALYMEGYGNPNAQGRLATSVTGHVTVTGFGIGDVLYTDNMGVMSAITNNGLSGATWSGTPATDTTKRAYGNGDGGEALWVNFPDYEGPTINAISQFDSTFETHYQTNAFIFG